MVLCYVSEEQNYLHKQKEEILLSPFYLLFEDYLTFVAWKFAIFGAVIFRVLVASATPLTPK